MIDIARGVQPFPDDAVTQTMGFIGRKGSGKTYGAGKLVEQMLDQGSQVVVLDPLGNWYGLRLSESGKSEGYDITIIGGEHGDLPINEHSGRLIADLVVDHGISVVIDLSPFSKSKRKQFAADFFEHLFERKKTQRSPAHLIIEEAHLFAPQFSKQGSERMLGAIEDIVRLGRNYGIGASLIDQRPQSVNKEVLNQIECLFTFQLTGPHERKAIKEWVVHAGVGSTEMVDDLPSLKVGECYLWSPAWLGILQKTRIKKKRTYDSTGTPTAGTHDAVEVRPLSEDDLAAVREKMADLIEEQEANDPARLKRRIRELEAELQNAAPSGYTEEQVREVVADRERQIAVGLEAMRKNIYDAIKGADFGIGARECEIPAPAPLAVAAPSAPRLVVSPTASVIDSSIPKAQRKVLESIAWYESVGISRPTTTQIAIMAGFSPSSSHTGNMLSKLVPTGYIERGNGDAWLTDAGRKVVTPPKAQTLAELHQSLLGLKCISGAPSQVLAWIIEHTTRAGDELTTNEVAEGMGWSTTSSHTGNMLSKLAAIGVLDRSNGVSRTTEILYPRGLK